MREVERTQVKAYCNVLAMEQGLDPGGYGRSFDDAVLLETPLPWKRDFSRQAETLPQEVIQLLGLWLQRYQAGEGYHHLPLMIAPDTTYSREGYRRVLYYSRVSGAFAYFDKIEYSLPQTEVGALVWALFEARDEVPRFEQYRMPQDDVVRDILVCTHGTVDAACAKFGYPLYNDLRSNYASETLRVWRVSHFGGHVFAPTLMDMPTGHYWAYVESAQTQQIIKHSGEVASLYGHYRGWAGLPSGFMQAAERPLWQQHGWAWFDYHKKGNVLAQDPNEEHPQWAEVQISFAAPDGSVQGEYQIRVEVQRHVETITTTGYPDTYQYPQYIVTKLEQTS